MLNSATLEQLRDMKLSTMAKIFDKQTETANISELSFEERFGLIVDAEWTNRRNNRLKRLIKNANFNDSNACIENVEYHSDRNLDKDLITRLGTCGYVSKHNNIIILGSTGNGKSFLANALGIAACRNFMTVKYARLPELLTELDIARKDGTFRKVIKAYKAVDLLILDEWLLTPLRDTESKDLLEIAEARYGKGSIVFCSQFDVGGWHEKIGDPTLADAICDRIVHGAINIIVGGNESMRKRKNLPY